MATAYSHHAAILNKLWSLSWSAYIGASLVDPRFSIQYIGRYTKKAVMAEDRIVFDDGKIVRFSYKDYANGAKTSYMTLKVYTFIGRLIRHIPDKHFPMIRYTGINPLQWPNCDKPLTFVGCFFVYWNPLQHLFEKAGNDATIAAALLRPG